MLKEKIVALSEQAKEFPRLVLDNNLFTLLGKAKELEGKAEDLQKLSGVTFPELVDNRIEEKKLFKKEEYNRMFEKGLITLIEEHLAKIQKLPIEDGIKVTEEAVRKTIGLITARREIKTVRELERLMKNSNMFSQQELSLLFQPNVGVNQLIDEVISEQRVKGALLLTKEEIVELLQSRLPLKIEKMRLINILDELIQKNRNITINFREYILTKEFDQIVNDFLEKVPKNIEGVSYLQLLKKVEMPKGLIDKILENLGEEGRVVREETAEKGEILYFPELYSSEL